MVDAARQRLATPARRDAVLEAVANAAERFLLAEAWEEAAGTVLAGLGGAAEVSRAWILRNHEDERGRLCASQVVEWCADGLSSHQGEAIVTSQPWDEGFSRWAQAHRRGEVVAATVRDLPQEERRPLEALGIVSLVEVPVFVAGLWWGTVGLEDLAEIRDWEAGETVALRAVAGILGAALQRRRADEDRTRAEARYRRLIERIPGVTYLDVPGEAGVEMGFVSPQIADVLGYPSDAFTTDPTLWLRLIHPDDLERLTALNAFDIADLSPFDHEYRMSTADGRTVWVHDTSAPVFDDQGGVEYFLGFMTDITARKAAESRQAEAEERYRALVEHIPAVVYAEAIRANAEDFYISPQVERILGYAPEDWRWTGNFWRDHLHPDDRAWVMAQNERANRTGEPFRAEYRFLAADGSYRWIHDEAVRIEGPDGGPRYWQGVLIDISERKAVEASLRKADERYRAVVEHVPAVIYAETPDGDPDRFFISPQVQAIFGYTPEEWTWTPDFWVDRIHPQDRPAAVERDAAANADLRPYESEYRFRIADGSYRWVHDEAVFVPDEEDGAGFWQGFLLDITPRREAEDRLREAELKFRTIVEQNQAIFYTQEIDPEDPSLSRITYVAPGNTQMLGYTLEDVAGDPTLWRQITHPDDRERVFVKDAEANRSGGRFSMEYRMIAKDGTIVWVQDEATLVELPGKPPSWQGFLLDITERKEAETQLERALEVEREATQRLRALDEMKNTFLQAVSHDLRTPLAAILGLAITLERRDVHLPEGEARDLAGRIAANARRLDRLVANLLDMDRLARGIVTPKLGPVDVGELVRRTIEESQLIGEGRLHAELPSTTMQVDAAKVERIVENLLANTARHTPAEAAVWVSVVPTAEPAGVTIEVADEGSGVPEELRETIFEPFRQGPGAPPHSPGVGVGLTLVRRFAELHGGRAWVQERPGGGASFRVWLPGGTDHRETAGDGGWGEEPSP
jgi:PAS domain S-box-containing protein